MTDAAARPAFEPLNDLERLLMAAASGGADQRAAFEAAVADAELWVVPACAIRAQLSWPSRLKSLHRSDFALRAGSKDDTVDGDGAGPDPGTPT